MQILWVDDDDDQRVLIEAAVADVRAILEGRSKDITMLHAASGSECLALLNDSLPDLLLLDVNMPGLSGFDVLQSVRTDARLKLLPVVMLSTTKNPADVQRCYNLGCNTFLSKPLRYDNMVNSLKLLVEYWTQAAVLPHAKTSTYAR